MSDHYAATSLRRDATTGALIPRTSYSGRTDANNVTLQMVSLLSLRPDVQQVGIELGAGGGGIVMGEVYC